ncbi:hypothetical protein ACFV1N_13145 [Streptosporangium canum]|uniref:hypothetical protein n=1 Tax=Streptosporangium canum TaxID=324952 RepID=UPI0036B9F2A3
MQTLTDLVGGVPQILANADNFISDHPIVSAIVAAVALVIAVLGYLAGRAALRAGKRLPVFLASRIAPRPVEDTLTVIAAGIATVVSASGMWQFFERIMPGVDWPWRLIMFAFIEVAVITSAVRAKRSMKAKYSAGVDGIAVWTLTSLSAVLSAMEAASLPEGVFRLAAPLVAAWLWERGMAIERHRITGLAGIHWRITPERILVRLGLAEAKDRTASEVDIHRRLTRVALAAKRVHQLAEAGASKRRIKAAITKRDRALDRAVEHTDLARDKTKQATLLDIVTTLGGGNSITSILETAAAPWADLDHPAVTGAQRNSDAVELAGALDRWTNTIDRKRSGDREVSAAVTSLAAFATGRHLPTAGSATSYLVAPQVAEMVAGAGSLDLSDADWSALLSAPTATNTATAAATPGEVAEQVAPEVAECDDMDALIVALNATAPATDAATANATKAMWRYWEHATQEEGRIPTGAELARAGGCNDSYGRKMRKVWYDQLDSRTRRRLDGAKKATA